MGDLIYKDEVFMIVGAAMAVYNELGFGFLEAVYQEALEVELAARTIPFTSQQELHILYHGHPLQKYYVADIVAYDKIIIELKAISQLTSCEQAQLLNYLKATGIAVGLLINFGNPNTLEFKRMVLTPDKRELKEKKTHAIDR
jgi:GxxExxY protein